MPNKQITPYEEMSVSFPAWSDTALFFFLSAFLVAGFSILNLMEISAIAQACGLLSVIGFVWTALTVPINFSIRRQAYFSMLSGHSPDTIQKAIDSHGQSEETRQKLRSYINQRQAF